MYYKVKRQVCTMLKTLVFTVLKMDKTAKVFHGTSIQTYFNLND